MWTVNCIFQPFNATRINASAINERVNVLEKENGSQGSGKAGFLEEFEVCVAESVINVSVAICHWIGVSAESV